MDSKSLENEFEYYAHVFSYGRMFDPFSLPFDIANMIQEKKNSTDLEITNPGLNVQLNDLSGAGKLMEGAANISKELREFLSSIFRPILEPGAKELGELLADPTRILRLNIWLSVAEKTRKKVEKLGYQIKPPNLNILVPIMEKSSVEENEEKQNRWSNLLLSEITEGDVHPSIPEILEQITSTEAKILDLMYHSLKKAEKDRENQNRHYYNAMRSKGFSCIEIKEKIDFSDYLIDNLIRLNLCKPTKFHHVDNYEAQKIAGQIRDLRLDFSTLGRFKGEQLTAEAYAHLIDVIKTVGKTVYKPSGEYERITLTPLGIECVNRWSNPPSDTSSQTSAS